MVFYCLNYLHLFRIKKKGFGFHRSVCENRNFYYVLMPSKSTKLLEFNQFWNSKKILSIIYADLERLIKRIDGCKNNL